MKPILCAVILSLLAGCSTNWKDLFEQDNSEERNKELMESFGAQDEVLEKYTEQKDKASEAQAKEVEVGTKKTPVISEPVSRKTQPEKSKSKQSAAAKKAQAPKAEVSAFPADYPDKLKKMSASAQQVWEEYTPIFIPGETVVMDINYMGVSTGKIVLTTEQDTVIGNTPVFHATAKVKTADYYRYLYELDDSVDSYISKETLLPVKFSLIQRESGKEVDDLQLFDREKLTTFSFYKRVQDGKTKKKKKEEFTPTHYTDPLSVVWFLRGLPMEKGKEFVIPIMNRGKIIVLKARVDGRERLSTQIGEKDSYKVRATTAYTGETLKSGDMTFWFSADDKKTFLKFNAKIKIGSISGEVEKLKQ